MQLKHWMAHLSRMSQRLRRMLTFGGGALFGRTSFLMMTLQSISRPDTLLPLILAIIILFFLFDSPLFSLAVGVGAGVFFLVFGSFLRIIYGWIFRSAG